MTGHKTILVVFFTKLWSATAIDRILPLVVSVVVIAIDSHIFLLKCHVVTIHLELFVEEGLSRTFGRGGIVWVGPGTCRSVVVQ